MAIRLRPGGQCAPIDKFEICPTPDEAKVQASFSPIVQQLGRLAQAPFVGGHVPAYEDQVKILVPT